MRGKSGYDCESYTYFEILPEKRFEFIEAELSLVV